MSIIINSQIEVKKKKPPMQTYLHKGLFHSDIAIIYERSDSVKHIVGVTFSCI